MSYCIHCGVELMDSEERCPLCGTPIYEPGRIRRDTPYPPPPISPVSEASMTRAIYLWIGHGIVLIALLATFICDIATGNGLSWFGYVAGGLGVAYLALILPFWFRRRNPVIFTPIVFAGSILYLLYLNQILHGDWFLPFAFPAAGALALLITALITLLRYLHRGQLYIWGGAFILLGGYTMLVELLISLHWTGLPLVWSYYSLITLSVIGLFLILTGICRPIRRSLSKKFFF